MNTQAKLPAALSALVLLAACAHGSRSTEAEDRGSKPLAPQVDHHLHLLSPAAAQTRLSETELPEPLATLVREREKHWNDAQGLQPLFVEDSALFNGREWLSGPKEIATFLANGYTGPYLFKAVTHRTDETEGQISGYLIEGDGTAVPFAFFQLALTRAGAGPWRIQTETQLFPGPAVEAPLYAADLLERMDKVGIERGVVLSNAYYFAVRPVASASEYEKVKAENDWTAGQVAGTGGRLAAFCSFNPLREYALPELERCARSGAFKGVKLHLNGAQLDFKDAAQVSKVRQVMEAANAHGLPLIIHVRSSDTYGREDAEVFLRELVAAAPDVTIQIAHLWGGESFSSSALAVYADAVAAGDPVTRNLFFDISGAWSYGKPHQMEEIVSRIRQIGLGRILYASDAPPAEAWAALRAKVPLTEEELRVIAQNVAPYMRDPEDRGH